MLDILFSLLFYDLEAHISITSHISDPFTAKG